MFSFNFFDPDTGAAGAATDGAIAVGNLISPAHPITIVSAPAGPVATAIPFSHGLVRTVVDADAVSGCAGRDVVNGQYEGGAKIWECTSDVLDYLSLPGSLPPLAPAEVVLRGSTVVDLGCGAGVLSCFASQHGALRVVCQDLNEAVLRAITGPNLLLNGALDSVGGRRPPILAACTWASLLDLMRERVDAPPHPLCELRDALRHSCDVALASEVLYHEENYGALAGLLQACLREPAGVAVIGSKRHYYGAELGGGSLSFVDFVNRSADVGAVAPGGGMRLRLVARVAHSIEDGRSMTRDVIIVTWGAAAPAAVGSRAA